MMSPGLLGGQGLAMPQDYSDEARMLITERCLIAADIDKTVLMQAHAGEREDFLSVMAPQLIAAAALGTHLALLTGNSMDELCSRFLRWLIDDLSHKSQLQLLDRFHFFCNSGGVYARFRRSDSALDAALGAPEPPDACALFEALTTPTADGKVAIRPRFVDSTYIARSLIPRSDVERLTDIMGSVAADYFAHLRAEKKSYESSYDLSALDPRPPGIDTRIVDHGSDESPNQATVQITMKPILSFRHARRPEQIFGKDVRTRVIQKLQRKLDDGGLGHYVARAGGRSSIDVTLEKLDKAYALEWLIDHLNLQGWERWGQKFGSNAIYFGDEVLVGGGNDYPVTRIPGLLVFAVSSEKSHIPLLSHVFVPSAILEGPDATADVLAKFNRCARRLLRSWKPGKRGRQARARTALEALKEEIFAERISSKISALKAAPGISVDDWQTLHAFVTLMCRDDPAARQWLALLIDELDSIMTQLSSRTTGMPPALGASHPDS